jgi:hypothetical protein
LRFYAAAATENLAFLRQGEGAGCARVEGYAIEWVLSLEFRHLYPII